MIEIYEYTESNTSPVEVCEHHFWKKFFISLPLTYM